VGTPHVFWDKANFLNLQSQQVFVDNGSLRLQARHDNQLWTIVFTQEAGQWKIDGIGGFPTDWQARLLPNNLLQRLAHPALAQEKFT
jgi:hypothetical protein